MNLKDKITKKRQMKKREEARNLIRKDIENLEEEMKRTETVFNFTTDEYLLESVIFEQNSQKAKMNYLLRLAREI
ncbi:MAG: DUF2508 family protein [Oscillospiraceae bacterium]|nr:DUF2508 family protein [Oscillospiraceae bacterium]